LVWVRGVSEPIVASRSEEAITRDLVAPGDRSLRADQLATALERLVEASDGLPPVLQQAIRQETGQDFAALARDGRSALED
jgi:ABC-type phosphate transport system auxiliary subunit